MINNPRYVSEERTSLLFKLIRKSNQVLPLEDADL